MTHHHHHHKKKKAKVSFNVPLIPQASDRTCWYASAHMLLSWSNGGKAIKEADAVQNAAKNNITINLDVGSMKLFGDSEGLKYHQFLPAHTGVDGLRHLLASLQSPLWYMGKNNGFNTTWDGGHVVVITGIEGDTVHYNDPWPVNAGEQGSRQINDFFNRLSPPDPTTWAVLYAAKGK